MEDERGLPPGAFAKLDDEDDEIFYEPPRLVCHIDDGAIAALTGFYRSGLPTDGVLLDLMSSWVSHLPPEIGYKEVIGHGMNAAELAANPRLSRWFIQNLNRETSLPLSTASIDAVMICVSVQYLQQPVVVLREVAQYCGPADRSSSAFRTDASGPRPSRSGARSTTRGMPVLSGATCAMPGLHGSKPTNWRNGSRI